jgi:hypothetical protein
MFITSPVQSNLDIIMDYMLSNSESFTLSQEIAEAVQNVLQDPIMHEVMARTGEFVSHKLSRFRLFGVKRVRVQVERGSGEINADARTEGKPCRNAHNSWLDQGVLRNQNRT